MGGRLLFLPPIMLAGMLPGMFPGMLRGTLPGMPLLVSVRICWRRRRRRCTRTASATVRSAVRSVMMKATEDDDGGDEGGDSCDGGIRNSQRIAFIGRIRRAPLTTNFEDASTGLQSVSPWRVARSGVTPAHVLAPQSESDSRVAGCRVSSAGSAHPKLRQLSLSSCNVAEPRRDAGLLCSGPASRVC